MVSLGTSSVRDSEQATVAARNSQRAQRHRARLQRANIQVVAMGGKRPSVRSCLSCWSRLAWDLLRTIPLLPTRFSFLQTGPQTTGSNAVLPHWAVPGCRARALGALAASHVDIDASVRLSAEQRARLRVRRVEELKGWRAARLGGVDGGGFEGFERFRVEGLSV